MVSVLIVVITLDRIHSKQNLVFQTHVDHYKLRKKMAHAGPVMILKLKDLKLEEIQRNVKHLNYSDLLFHKLKLSYKVHHGIRLNIFQKVLQHGIPQQMTFVVRII